MIVFSCWMTDGGFFEGRSPSTITVSPSVIGGCEPAGCWALAATASSAAEHARKRIADIRDDLLRPSSYWAQRLCHLRFDEWRAVAQAFLVGALRFVVAALGLAAALAFAAAGLGFAAVLGLATDFARFSAG